ncbi:hypothetical protein D1872_336870 [compost metagenome]
MPVGVFVNYFLLNQEIKKISFKLGPMKYVVGNIVGEKGKIRMLEGCIYIKLLLTL